MLDLPREQPSLDNQTTAHVTPGDPISKNVLIPDQAHVVSDDIWNCPHGHVPHGKESVIGGTNRGFANDGLPYVCFPTETRH